MMQMAAYLILINVFLILAIGLIRQENPFTVWVAGSLAAANVVVLLAAAIIGHVPSASAFRGLLANVLPLAFIGIGVALILLAMTLGARRTSR